MAAEQRCHDTIQRPGRHRHQWDRDADRRGFKHDTRWIRNVKRVENNLRVEWWENEGVRKTTANSSDTELKQAVRDELYQDFRISEPFEVTVEAKYGHVTLRGSLPTYDQKRMAEQDARAGRFGGVSRS